jgi:hypothetical protein
MIDPFYRYLFTCHIDPSSGKALELCSLSRSTHLCDETNFPTVRHSHMLLEGIQAKLGLDFRLKRSGMTALQSFDTLLLVTVLFIFSLLNHFRRSHEDHRWNRQAESLGGFEVDHQLKLGRLFDRQVGRLSAL